MAFPNAIERFIRKTIENVGGIIRQVRGKGRLEQQSEMKNEVIRKIKVDEPVRQEKNLNKTMGQYTRNTRSVKDEELLPKLRKTNGKGLKM